MALDLVGDFDLFDGTETVTYLHRNLAGAVLSSESVKALRRRTRFAPEAGEAGSQMMTALTRWHLKASDLTSPAKKGDQFQTSVGEVWELADASYETLKARWAVLCRKIGG